MQHITEQGCRLCLTDHVIILWFAGINIMSLYSLARLTVPLTSLYYYFYLLIKSFEVSLNALKCRLTGFNMDEIIHEDLQVSAGILTKEALLLACNCEYI